MLASVTLLAIPALGRFGARDDVPSLLNRPYGVLWLGSRVVVALVVLVAAVRAASLLRRPPLPDRSRRDVSACRPRVEHLFGLSSVSTDTSPAAGGYPQVATSGSQTVGGPL